MKLTDLVESGAKDLGVRFNLLNVFPTVLLFMFLLALFWSGAPAKTPDVNAVFENVENLGVKDGIFLALVVLGFGLVVHPLQFSLVRLLEGYWQTPLFPGIGRRLSEWRIKRHRDIREKLKTAAASESNETDLQTAAAFELRRRYPYPRRVLPTAFGNALRAAEDVPGKRYGLSGVTVWSKLYPLLPEKMIAILSDRRNQMDISARLCSVFFIAAAVSAIVLVKHGWWLLVPLVLLFLSWLSYRAAIAAAVAYGESVQTAYDLYRFEVLKAFKLPLPANLEEERKLNKMLSEFLLQNIDDDFKSVAYDAGKETS